ncbi:MAG: hypothetical protein A3J92_04485 [Planctomycetes bacterium RIFOXYC2_FULL_41_27]|nr:MAG: hypothetical protein A3J92_04485 [Planctomycetes bacterium RIFOXYC2_FULL_41_27]
MQERIDEDKPKETVPEIPKKPDKLLAFPHLVFKEFIALMLVSLVLIIISMAINAPLEEVATPTKTPNPAKAPWYFVGLQEMLVYFDPWIAGVMIPTLIIIGLMAIPFVDKNPKGVGIYCFKARKFAFVMFTIGIVAWFGLIIFGVYFRGPSWLLYMPWESWDIHKPVISKGNYILPLFIGVPATIGYYVLGLWLPIRFARNFYNTLGPISYFVTMFFVLSMFGFLGKIPLRFVFDIKYIIYTPWFSI